MDKVTERIHNIVDAFIMDNKSASLDDLLRFVYESGHKAGHRAGAKELEQRKKLVEFCHESSCLSCPLRIKDFRCGRGAAWNYLDTDPGSVAKATEIVEEYKKRGTKAKKVETTTKPKPEGDKKEANQEMEEFIDNLNEVSEFLDWLLGERS